MDKSAPRAMRYSNLPRVRLRAQSASIARLSSMICVLKKSAPQFVANRAEKANSREPSFHMLCAPVVQKNQMEVGMSIRCAATIVISFLLFALPVQRAWGTKS